MRSGDARVALGKPFDPAAAGKGESCKPEKPPATALSCFPIATAGSG